MNSSNNTVLIVALVAIVGIVCMTVFNGGTYAGVGMNTGGQAITSEFFPAADGDYCDDGYCSSSETCGSCSSDCGACSDTPVEIENEITTYESCGNGYCSPSETCSICPIDCGKCIPPSDVTPPIAEIYSPKALQVLAIGTKNIWLGVGTNENAACKWSSTDQRYSQMTSTPTAYSTSHITLMEAFKDGQTYTRYVRCADVAGNAMTTSVAVTFTVAAPDTTPPTATITAPTANQIFSTGTTQTTLAVTTNEPATCKWSTNGADVYTSMTNTLTGGGSTSHTTTLTGLANGQTYTRHVRCSDVAGNAMTTSVSRTFSVNPLSVSITYPRPNEIQSSGVTQTNVYAVTNGPAECRYGRENELPRKSFEYLFPMDKSGTAGHTKTYAVKTGGVVNTVYVTCKDSAGNFAESPLVNFSVYPTTCFDSDKGVGEFQVKGYVNGTNNGAGYLYEDYCISSSKLAEKTCTPLNVPTQYNMTCTCSNGRCI